MQEDRPPIGRAKNEATVDDVLKCMRANGLTQARLDSICSLTEIETIIEQLKGFLLDLVDKTRRPTAAILKAAFAKEYNCSLGETHGWAQKVLVAISSCRHRGQRMVNGKKLPEAVRSIATKLASPMKSCPATPKRKVRALSPKSSPRRRMSSEATLSEAPSSSNSILALYRGSTARSAKEEKQTQRAPLVEDVVSSQDLLSQENAAPLYSSVIDIAHEGEGTANAGKIFVAPGERCVARVTGGVVEKAKMTSGLNGFLMAQFGDAKPFQTEIPVLYVILKRPSSRSPGPKVVKKPAARGKDSSSEERSSEVEEEDEGPDDAAHETPPFHVGAVRTYRKDWYKKGNGYGIRQKFQDRRQICTVKRAGVSKDDLEIASDALIAALEGGMEEDGCGDWVAKYFLDLLGEDID
jgi:hypothetical protein